MILPPSPASLFDLSTGYWRSCALFAGIELEIFDTIGVDGATEAELAAGLKLPSRSLSLLLEALQALELCEPTDGRWQNSPSALAYLVSGGPAYLGQTILFNAKTYGAWGQLADAVRQAQPPQPHDQFLGRDYEDTRNFVLAMHQRALGVAQVLTPMLPFADRRRLLDLGGGPATYAQMLAAYHPSLEITVVDLGPILEVAAGLHGQSPGMDRVTLRPGDIFADAPGVLEELAATDTPYDAILISGVIHRTEGSQTGSFLERALCCLAPGGMLAVSDLFTGLPEPGPVLPELFSLHMLVTADSGRALEYKGFEKTLRELGQTDLQTIRLPAPLPHKPSRGP